MVVLVGLLGAKNWSYLVINFGRTESVGNFSWMAESIKGQTLESLHSQKQLAHSPEDMLKWFHVD